MDNIPIHSERFTTTCADGLVLSGILLLPKSAKAVVQFNGGTAAKKEFYLPFVTYLAAHGYIVCLWDYRGSGDSKTAHLKDFSHSFVDYGVQDIPAIKTYLRHRFPDLPFLFFGHSVGGQQVGFGDTLEDVLGMVCFAVSTGYLFHMPLSYRLLSFYFFYIFSPISVFLTGYVAAKRFGIMEDLPRQVVADWRDWCMKRDYFFAPEYYGKSVPKGQFHALPFPVKLYWTTDDPISNARSVPTFWQHIRSKHAITITKVTPQEIGEKSIGHFGFFKKRMKGKLWEKAVNDLDEFLVSA